MGLINLGVQPQPEAPRRRFRVIFRCDYGELDGPPWADFVVGEEYGRTAATVHATIAAMLKRRDEIVLVDLAGDLWDFHRDTVRGFWVLDA